MQGLVPLILRLLQAAILSIAGPAMAETCLVADPSGTPLNVRGSPNGSMIGALKNDVRVSLGNRRGDWVHIVPHAGSGKSGWVVKKYLDCNDAPTTGSPEPPTNAEIDGNVILYACASDVPKDRGFCHI